MNLKLILLVATIAFNQTLPAQRVKRKAVVEKQVIAEKEQDAWFKIEDLRGSWKEVSRKNILDQNISYTDTILLKIDGANSLTKVMGSMGFALKGAAIIEDLDYLNISEDRYKILKADKKNLRLKTHKYKHQFIKISSFPQGVNYAPPKTEVLKKVVTVDISQIKGDWEVYRRDAAPGFITDKTVLVKSFTIADFSGKIAKGTMACYDSKNVILPLLATYNFEAGKMEITLTATTFHFTVYEANARNMIFGEKDGVMNYARKK